MKKNIKYNFFYILAFIFLIGITTVFGASITPKFPTTANNFSEGDVIEEEDWNAIENTIGITSTTSTATLHGKWNDLFASTTLPQITTLLNLTSIGTVGTGVWQGTAVGDSYITKTGNWTGTFDSQEGSYYLNAGNLTNFGTPFYTYFNATTTDALSEGSTNLYSQWSNATGGINYASNNVGIGTTSPYAKLSVVGTTVGTQFYGTSTNTTAGENPFLASNGWDSAPAYSFFGDPDTGMSSGGANAIKFTVGGVNQMELSSSGYLGLGETTPGYRLEITGTSLVSAGTKQSRYSDSVFAPTNRYYKARGTEASPMGVLTNDILARLGNAYGYSDGDYRAIGYIDFLTGATTTDAIGGKLSIVLSDSAGTLKNRLSIDDTGKVGIGTSVPSKLLDVTGDIAGGIAQFTRTPSSASDITYGVFNIKATHDGNMSDGFGAGFQFYIQDDAGVSNVISSIQADRDGADNSGSLKFVVNNLGSTVDALIIKPTGNVGIGTSTPQSKLSIGSTLDTVDEYAQIDAESGAPAAADCDSNLEAGRMIVETSGGTGAYRLYICTGATDGWDYQVLTD